MNLIKNTFNWFYTDHVTKTLDISITSAPLSVPFKRVSVMKLIKNTFHQFSTDHVTKTLSSSLIW